MVVGSLILKRITILVAILVAILMAGVMGCAEEAEDGPAANGESGTIAQANNPDAAEALVVRCETEQAFPYPSTSPYVGVHGGPGNNDSVPCDTSAGYERSWHALEGFAIAQPNTFSPDGLTTYVTTSQPNPSDCNLQNIH